MVRAARSLESEITTAGQGEGWHPGLRAAFFSETHSSAGQPGSVAEKKQDNASSTCVY